MISSLAEVPPWHAAAKNRVLAIYSLAVVPLRRKCQRTACEQEGVPCRSCSRALARHAAESQAGVPCRSCSRCTEPRSASCTDMGGCPGAWVGRAAAPELRLAWLRDVVRSSIITLDHVTTDANLADIFTKVLPASLHNQFRNILMSHAPTASIYPQP